MNQRISRLLMTAFSVSALGLAGCSSAGSSTETDSGGPTVDSGKTPTKDSGGMSSQKDSGPTCGATASELCATGSACKANADCTSTVCELDMCVAASCGDKIKDGTETDIDCGGKQCTGCPTGDACKAPTDCVSGVCTGDVCQAPTDTDMVKNDSETDVDCGGGLLTGGAPNPKSDGAPTCAVGKTCAIGLDCATLVCATGPVLINNLDAGVDADASLMTSDAGSGALTCQPATDHDGVKNDSETDVDCGGGLLVSGQPNTASDGAPACGSGKKCVLTTDCISLVCGSGVCDAPSPTDGVQNDSETDTDCGGALLADGTANPASDGAPACANTKKCVLGTDCVSLVCAPGPVGSSPSLDGGPIDCSSGGCTCQPPVPTDGVKNDSETDIDCGGAILAAGGANPASDGAPVCAVGQGCLLGSDCVAGVCNNNANAGGPPINCPTGDTCQCQVPSSNDGVQNGGETGIDCGGTTAPGSDGAPPCGTGLGCVGPSDCQSGVCANKLCAAPTDHDGIQNDSETDVDCGGGTLANGMPNTASDGAPDCADSKKCVLDTDCLSSFCSTITNTCVDGQSCKGLITPAQIMDLTVQAGSARNGTDAVGVPDPNGVGQHAGLDTCGAGESTDSPALQAHESCCKSLPVPGLAACSPTVVCPTGETCSSLTGAGTCQVRMDKYEATSGRVRQFVESVNEWAVANGKGAYNMQAWVTAQLAANNATGKLLAIQIPTSGSNNVVPLFPTGDATGGELTYLNVVTQLGGTTIDAGHPSDAQGCYVDQGAYGASTYWWPSAEVASVGSPPRPFTQDYYDIKPQNCSTYWIAAAFCAWDGGRLPTLAEARAVYGTGSYPWSASTTRQPVLWSGQAPGALDTLASNAGYAITDYTVDYHNSDLGSSTGLGDFYYYPSYVSNNPAWAANVDTLDNGLDITPYIAAPGRFVLDETSVHSPDGEGWMDYGANMLEFLQTTSLTNGDNTAAMCDTTDNVKPTGSTCPAGYNCQSSVYCGVVRSSVLPGSYWEGGSWEGHGIEYDGYNEPLFTQYGKAGFRCVRPVEP